MTTAVSADADDSFASGRASSMRMRAPRSETSPTTKSKAEAASSVVPRRPSSSSRLLASLSEWENDSRVCSCCCCGAQRFEGIDLGDGKSIGTEAHSRSTSRVGIAGSPVGASPRRSWGDGAGNDANGVRSVVAGLAAGPLDADRWESLRSATEGAGTFVSTEPSLLSLSLLGVSPVSNNGAWARPFAPPGEATPPPPPWLRFSAPAGDAAESTKGKSATTTSVTNSIVSWLRCVRWGRRPRGGTTAVAMAPGQLRCNSLFGSFGVWVVWEQCIPSIY